MNRRAAATQVRKNPDRNPTREKAPVKEPAQKERMTLEGDAQRTDPDELHGGEANQHRPGQSQAA